MITGGAGGGSRGGGGGGGDKTLLDSSGVDIRLLYRIAKIMLFVAVVVLPSMVLYNSAYSSQFLPALISRSELKEFPLDIVLEKAAMGDKTVILTTVNGAWAANNSLLDLFLESFHIGNNTKRLLNHLVIIAFDQKSYARCLALHPLCYALKTEGVDFSGEAYYSTPNYLEMMWRRIDFLRSILTMGYSFIFTDADIMWFQDPFQHFFQDADFQITCDTYIGNPYDVNNRPNGGFTYVKSNNRTIEFYKFWYASRVNYLGNHDQDVLNRIKYDPYISQIGLKIRFLDTTYFGGFCEPSKDFNLVCTMHANCCFGIDNKVHDLRVMLEDWRIYISSPQSKKAVSTPSWRVPQNCSLASFHPPERNVKESNI
ncbi:uncharacterized protein At4g15970-like [Vitis riparia]|uniref:uncharacterized protein At4g15970-like n=1 Tax=Vitis riparia TaxID=96939 RepID=UPI00155A4A95|nr:uncharacterized protein At4g15970-like [Vitis riparia]